MPGRDVDLHFVAGHSRHGEFLAQGSRGTDHLQPPFKARSEICFYLLGSWQGIFVFFFLAVLMTAVFCLVLWLRE
jgi:hypothetical protein